jgi:hypothetical protein
VPEGGAGLRRIDLEGQSRPSDQDHLPGAGTARYIGESRCGGEGLGDGNPALALTGRAATDAALSPWRMRRSSVTLRWSPTAAAQSHSGDWNGARSPRRRIPGAYGRRPTAPPDRGAQKKKFKKKPRVHRGGAGGCRMGGAAAAWTLGRRLGRPGCLCRGIYRRNPGRPGCGRCLVGEEDWELGFYTN